MIFVAKIDRSIISPRTPFTSILSPTEQTLFDAFIKVMNSWREAFLQSSSLPIVGATEAQLNAIHSPACLIAGNDIVHTPVTAHKAAGLLPNSELHEDVVEKLPEDKLRHTWDRKEWRDAEPQIAEIFTTFLMKAESGR